MSQTPNCNTRSVFQLLVQKNMASVKDESAVVVPKHKAKPRKKHRHTRPKTKTDVAQSEPTKKEQRPMFQPNNATVVISIANVVKRRRPRHSLIRRAGF